MMSLLPRGMGVATRSETCVVAVVKVADAAGEAVADGVVGEATRSMIGVSVRWEVDVTVGEVVEGGVVGGGSASGGDDCTMRVSATPTTMMTKNIRSMKGSFFSLGWLLSKLNGSSIKREQDLS